MSSERLVYGQDDVIQASVDSIGIRISEQWLEAYGDNKDTECYGNMFSTCLGSPKSNKGIRISCIPYKYILWCESVDSKNEQDIIEVTYIHPSESVIRPGKIQVQIQNSISGLNEISSEILAKSYKNNLIQPSVLVLINPHGGQGKAAKIYESEVLPILNAAKVKITYLETKYHSHALDIAKDLNVEDYDIIACCSGDGIPHEVINGFYQRPDKGLEAFNKIAITQLPSGSGNALSLSTHGSNDATLATFLMLKAERTKLDLMAVTQGTGEKETTKLSFLTQCYGIIADSDIGTEHLRWMGPIRFDLGVVRGVLNKSKYPCDLYVNYFTQTKEELSDHFNNHCQQNFTSLKKLTEDDLNLSFPKLDEPLPSNWIKISDKISSNLNILYVGKMPYVSHDVQFFPAALPNDGTMDMVISDTNSSIAETVSILLSLDKGLHVHNKKIHHAKILGYRLVPKLKDPKNHYLSVDGENFPFEPLHVEILPGIMTGLLQNSNYVDTCFTK